MADNIVGMLFCKNEGDILAQTIEAALPKVDSLMIADDGSTDNSWEIIKCMKRAHKDKIELAVKRQANRNDKGQRTFLLNEIRKRYKPENTWVQVIESDIMILDTDVRKAIKEHSVHDIAMSWIALNAAREAGTWKEVDTYPHWGRPLIEIMDKAHWLEVMLYTYRPLEKLYFGDHWRPWPQGFSNYTSQPVKGSYGRKPSAPLLLHVGYRGPTHFHKKYYGKWPNNRHPKYKEWDVSTPESCDKTVWFFNGYWNKELYPASRAGWKHWRRS